MMSKPHPVVLSGCSGGGKSSVVQALRALGFCAVDEPGRRVVREQQHEGGSALPWVDLPAFARRCIELARSDLDAAADDQWVFFDRGLVDAAAALRHHTGHWGAALEELHRYHQQVFLTPPWPALYATDTERQLGLDDAVAEYHRLHATYAELGYTVTVLPTTDVASRVDLILGELGILGHRENS